MNLEKMQSTRRFYHRIAEPGWMEFQTTVNIIKSLKEMGYDVKYGREIISDERMGLPDKKKVDDYKKNLHIDADFDISEILEGYTGALVILDTKRPGPVIGMRFDIDANDIEESKEENHRPMRENFRSQNDFAAHCCGHDGHITIGLAVAEYLMKNKDNLNGKYIIIFQPAEEGARGAKSMISKNFYDDIDYFLAMHLGINLPTGKIGVGSTGFLATAKIDARFKGLATHAGATPELGHNALLAAASATLNLHTIPQHSKGMSRVNVGVIEGGSGRNVVPENAKINFEVRGENVEILEYLVERSKEITKGAGIQYGVDVEYEEVGYGEAIKYKDIAFYDEIDKYLKSKGFDTVRDNEMNASEDVTYFMNKVTDNGGKAIHFLIGSDLAASHHNGNFDFDEKSLQIGTDVITNIIEYLQK